MEWLINRRRMMYNKVLPPDYMAFEDPYVADLCAYFWGDTETMTTGETLKTGTIVGDDNTAVDSEPAFVCGMMIPAHKKSSGTTIAQVSGRSVSYRVYLSISGSSGSDIWDATTVADTSSVVFAIKELQRASLTWNTLKSVTKANWNAEKTSNTVLNYDSTSGKYYADFSTTSGNCKYVILDVMADSNVTINWEIKIISGTVYKPVGITLKQCQAVTNETFMLNASVMNALSNNPYITKFNEFQHFTGVTSIDGVYNGSRTAGFWRDRNLSELTLPSSVTELRGLALNDMTSLTSLDFKNVQTIGMAVLASSGIHSFVLNEGFTTIGNNNNFSYLYADFPSTTTNIGNVTFSQHYQVNVCRATTPPTLASGALTRMKRLYVPQASLEAYKTANIWSNVASKIYPIEGSYYETHRSLDPNEPA